MRRSLFSLALLATVACLEPELPAPVLGEWGGEHLGLVATLQEVQLEFDCATGRTSAAITPDAAGRFAVAGFHVPGHGGPIREDDEPVAIAARFDGTVRGDLMTISVTLPEWATTLGPYTLVRGASPRVFKCL